MIVITEKLDIQQSVYLHLGRIGTNDLLTTIIYKSKTHSVHYIRIFFSLACHRNKKFHKYLREILLNFNYATVWMQVFINSFPSFNIYYPFSWDSTLLDESGASLFSVVLYRAVRVILHFNMRKQIKNCWILILT